MRHGWILVGFLCLPGCEIGMAHKPDGTWYYVSGVLTTPAIEGSLSKKPDGTLDENLKYQRGNDLAGVGQAIGAGIKAAK
jgi:hypothetical protein